MSAGWAFAAVCMIAGTTGVREARPAEPRSVASPSAGPQAAPESLVDTAPKGEGLAWRHIGPFRGGRVTAVTGVPAHPHRFFFGATGGGVWKTENAGNTWDNISDGFFGGSIGAIAVACSDPNVIYVGTGESPIRGVATSHGVGVYRSTDGGASWQHIGLDDSRHISAIRVHPTDARRVFVAAQGSAWGPSEARGVYRSADGGESWEKTLFVDDSTGAVDLSMDATNPRVLFAAMWDHRRTPWQVRSGGPGSGLYKSTDSGATWEKLAGGLPEVMGKSGIAVSPANPSRVWAVIEAGDGGLYRSDDGGESWKRVNGHRSLWARAWYYMHVFADPSDEDNVFVLNAPFLRSIDGGATFASVPTPHGDNHSLWISPTDRRVMINGNDGGANVSLDGGKTWSTQTNQPTAQIYRVITDNQVPYQIYGGQQDNTTVAIKSRTFEGGIGAGDWHAVGGGESAHVAFDRDDPSLVYATSIVGVITEWNRRTGAVRSIEPTADIGLGSDAAEVKYRFNWNPPVLVSSRDPRILYFAGNQVLRSDDRGTHWREVSGDLTRNQKQRHGPAGVPFTNEAAGGEIYNTILTLEESPHDGTLWVGTDDGLVHRSNEDGTWSDVSPDVGEAMINAIEISSHDPDRIYLAVTRYKWDDLAPMIYRTRDGGRSWDQVVAGLPEGQFVRVVREDPARAGLLYCGTEFGMHVSVDDGETWTPFQHGLPIVPITDLEIHRDNLVAATQGRGLWILDDLGPIRQWTESVARADHHLFAATEATLWTQAESFVEKPGKNPVDGAVLTVYFREAPDSESTTITLEVIDADGDVVRAFHNRKSRRSSSYERSQEPHAKEGKPYGVVSFKEGLNTVVWDLRRENVTSVPGHLIPSGWRGPRVPAGMYRVRFTVDGRVSEIPLPVRDDPRLEEDLKDAADDAAHRERATLVELAYRTWDDLHRAVVRERSIRDQLRERLDLTEDTDVEEPVSEIVTPLLDVLAIWEEGVLQAKRETQQDIVAFENQLSLQLGYLVAQLDGNGPPVTAAMRARLETLREEWSKASAELDVVLAEHVARTNARLRELSVPIVYVRPLTPSER